MEIYINDATGLYEAGYGYDNKPSTELRNKRNSTPFYSVHRHSMPAITTCLNRVLIEFKQRIAQGEWTEARAMRIAFDEAAITAVMALNIKLAIPKPSCSYKRGALQGKEYEQAVRCFTMRFCARGAHVLRNMMPAASQSVF